MVSEAASHEFTAEGLLAAHGQSLTKAMFTNEEAPEVVRVTKLVERPARVVLKLDAKDETFLAKAFDPTSERGTRSLHREVAVLQELAATGLGPRLLGYSKDNNWLVMEYVPGKRLDKVLTDQTARTYAVSLGQWYRSYTDAVIDQGQNTSSNWFDYLRKVKSIGSQKIFDQFRELLEPLEIDRRIVAKTDVGLQNFVLDEDGDLIGFDFERSTLKPYGWDLLVTATFFARRFPQRAQEMIDALLEGWNGGTDKLNTLQMRALMQAFVALTAGRLKREIEK